MTPNTIDKNVPGFPDETPLMNLAAATEFLTSNAGDYFNSMIISYSTFLTFGIDKIYNYQDQGNGSCFFLRTPQKLLLVTAAHVFEEFMAAKAKDIRIKAFVGGHEFPLKERLISTGRSGSPEDVDIATFLLKDEELTLLPGKAAIEYWPPQPPLEDNGIAFAGFPAEEQKHTKYGVEYGYYIATAIAKRVTDRQIEIDLKHRDLSDAIISGNTPNSDYKIGGMSGGPVFTLAYKKSSGIIFLILGGVISEVSPLQNDIIFAESADRIRADGSIRR